MSWMIWNSLRSLGAPRLTSIVLLVSIAACSGGSGSSPTSPDASAAVAADILSLTIYGCDAGGDNCRYSFGLKNTGTGCAGSLQGTIRQTLADAIAVSTSSWSVPGVVQPNQTLGVNGCCVTDLKRTGSFTIQPSFQTVKCS